MLLPLDPARSAAAAAAAPRPASPSPSPAQPGAPFISPMGEPFRARQGDDALADWFAQADRNHDGCLTVDEMQAGRPALLPDPRHQSRRRDRPRRDHPLRDVIAPKSSGEFRWRRWTPPKPSAATRRQAGSRSAAACGGVMAAAASRLQPGLTATRAPRARPAPDTRAGRLGRRQFQSRRFARRIPPGGGLALPVARPRSAPAG